MSTMLRHENKVRTQAGLPPSNHEVRPVEGFGDLVDDRFFECRSCDYIGTLPDAIRHAVANQPDLRR